MKLTDNEILGRLKRTPLWQRKALNKLSRDFVFPDFKSCFKFMTQVAALAEDLNHHPEWSNVYNQLSITFTTHDADPFNGGALTSLDFEIAEKIDAIEDNRTPDY
jgi:4a-hydroxytetrahydrobiopterin dehydratase